MNVQSTTIQYNPVNLITVVQYNSVNLITVVQYNSVNLLTVIQYNSVNLVRPCKVAQQAKDRKLRRDSLAGKTTDQVTLQQLYLYGSQCYIKTSCFLDKYFSVISARY